MKPTNLNLEGWHHHLVAITRQGGPICLVTSVWDHHGPDYRRKPISHHVWGGSRCLVLSSLQRAKWKSSLWCLSYSEWSPSMAFRCEQHPAGDLHSGMYTARLCGQGWLLLQHLEHHRLPDSHSADGCLKDKDLLAMNRFDDWRHVQHCTRTNTSASYLPQYVGMISNVMLAWNFMFKERPTKTIKTEQRQGLLRLAHHSPCEYQCEFRGGYEHFEAVKTSACDQGSKGLHFSTGALYFDSRLLSFNNVWLKKSWALRFGYSKAHDVSSTAKNDIQMQENILYYKKSKVVLKPDQPSFWSWKKGSKLRISGLYSSIKAIIFGFLMLSTVISFWAVISVELLHPLNSRIVFTWLKQRVWGVGGQHSGTDWSFFYCSSCWMSRDSTVFSASCG